eukprot:8577111-Pyramimonas_sp.AAC.1
MGIGRAAGRDASACDAMGGTKCFHVAMRSAGCGGAVRENKFRDSADCPEGEAGDAVKSKSGLVLRHCGRVCASTQRAFAWAR